MKLYKGVVKNMYKGVVKKMYKGVVKKMYKRVVKRAAGHSSGSFKQLKCPTEQCVKTPNNDHYTDSQT